MKTESGLKRCAIILFYVFMIFKFPIYVLQNYLFLKCLSFKVLISPEIGGPTNALRP